MSEELIVIVDKNDTPIGVSTKHEAQTKDLMHRIVIVHIKDKNGDILLQQRAPNMQMFPDCWDHSAAGHVDAGESYELAARRELREELGIVGANLQETAYYHSYVKIKGRHFNRFHKVYETVLPKTTKFNLQQAEVSAVRWFTRQQLRDFIHKYPQKIANGLVEVVERGII